ncbi:MAG TPA: hypothetical protein VGS14_11040 [Actinomycetes bacterium]|jgi:hypothetical protein|nr:hypothetical protein [Actinomycetes bacterium]
MAEQPKTASLWIMAEQPLPHDVVFYCDQCARRHGSRRLLAAADRYSEPGPGTAWPSDGWRLWLGRRSGRKVRLTSVTGPTALSGGGHPDKRRPRERVGPVLRPGGLRFLWVPLDMWAPAAQLICYKCSARPRVARAKLVELAEQAMAAGRHDAYV